MARLLPKPALEAVVAAARRHAEGATFIQLAAAVTPPPPMRTLQRWLSALVRDGRLVRIGHANSVRYQWVDPDAVGPQPGGGIPFPAATVVTQALQSLVGEQLQRRPPVSYHRPPERHAYLSTEVRALAASSRGVADAGRAVDATQARIVADLAWRCDWLEGGTLALPVVECLVAGQDVRCDAREAQFVRCQQAATHRLPARC